MTDTVRSGAALIRGVSPVLEVPFRDDGAVDEPGFARVVDYVLGSELIVAAEKLISQRRGLIGSAHCRAPAHRLDAEEVAMVDRFLTEFADLLPDLSA